MKKTAVEIIAEGTDTSYTKGSNSKVSIHCSGALSDFISVKMDSEGSGSGEDAGNDDDGERDEYGDTSDSTDTTQSAIVTNSSSPDTGDDSNVFVWIILLAMSMLVCTYMVYKKKNIL